jgi:hypothetical protein
LLPLDVDVEKFNSSSSSQSKVLTNSSANTYKGVINSLASSLTFGGGALFVQLELSLSNLHGLHYFPNQTWHFLD